MEVNMTVNGELKLDIGLLGTDREGVVSILSKVLADEYLLHTKTRNYHWNITGSQFSDLHKFFQSQYKELDTIIDEVAHRIRCLGEKSIDTLIEFILITKLQEAVGQYPDAKDMITTLLADHEPMIEDLRVDIETTADRYHDIGTKDFPTRLMETQERMV